MVTRKLNLWMPIALLFFGLSLTTVSCSSSDDDSIEEPRKIQSAFFTDEINRLIDANYSEIQSKGYGELIIPSSMFDKNIMKYADYHKDVMSALNNLGYKTYINGGAVRDAILGTSIHDLDFSTDATPEEMKEKLTGFDVIITSTAAGNIAQALHPNNDWTDMVPIRGVNELLRGKSFVPANATYGTFSKNLIDDTYGRDLTINSLYYDYQNNTIIDYHGGLHDLRENIIRTVYDPNTMYPINASALIRTVRFAARYGFDIDDVTTTAIKNNMHYCRETIKGSLNNYYITKGFGDGCAKRTYQYYSKYGIIDFFMPMLKGYAGKKDYETPLFYALDYAEGKTKMTTSLSMAILFLPVLQKELSSKEKTLENITAAWDKLEQGSGQKEVFEVDDYSGARTAMLNTFYVYFSLTDTSLRAEAKDKLKQNASYTDGTVLVDAYKK